MRTMHLVHQLVCLLVIATGLSSGLHFFSPRAFSEKSPSGRSPAEIYSMISSNIRPIIIDVRSPLEYTNGHIPGAINIQVRDWEALIDAIVAKGFPSRHLVFYCGTENCGFAKSIAQRVASEFGSERVSWIRGGWIAWEDLKLPKS